MFNGVKILCYIILFFSFIDIKRINSIIVIPFKISELDEDNAKFYYTTNDYFTDFIQPDYYSSLNIGEKNMRILARISPDNNTFFLSEEECKRKSIENAQDYGIMTRNSYRFSQSLSYKNISQFKNGGIISENFLFYNTTKLKCHPLSYDTYLDKEIDSQINISEFKIMIEEYTQNSMCGVIGLGKPKVNVNDEIYFITELKRNKLIDNYYFTYQFITSSSGDVIIGGLPHEYYNNSKSYKEFQFIKINSNSANENNYPWSILFNKIYLENKNKTIINIQNNVKSYLLTNLGFIIGTTQYKKIIMKNYFDSLISEGICSLEKINNNKIFGLNNEYFEMFSCDSNKIKDIHRDSFPYLKFQQNDMEFTFFLFFHYLFKEFKEKYYFLVIFPDENYSNNNWYLGLPFLRRYQFIYNYDYKTIGFYNENLKEKNETEKNKKSNFLKSNYKIFIQVGIIVLFIILIILAFIFGKKLAIQRKKRANELNDDNYEYFPNENSNPENGLNINA